MEQKIIVIGVEQPTPNTRSLVASPLEQSIVINYLMAIATTSSVIDTFVQTIKQADKSNTFNLLLALIPLLAAEIGKLVPAIQTLTDFAVFYEANNGLSDQERNEAIEYFKAEYQLNNQQAEILIETLIQLGLYVIMTIDKIKEVVAAIKAVKDDKGDDAVTNADNTNQETP